MADNYYLGGDRDDENNYAPVHTKNLNKQLKPTEAVKAEKPVSNIVLPSEFDNEFYDDHINKFGRNSEDYWAWIKFKNYANAVYPFYVKTCALFYKKFQLKEGETLPNYITTNINIDLEVLLKDLKRAETALISQYSKSRRTVQAHINKYVPLKRLVEHAGKAKIMYRALTENLCVADAINFKRQYTKLNLHKNLDVLKAFRGCRIMDYQIKKHVKPNTDFHNSIYERLDYLDLYNTILTSVDAFVTTDYQDIVISMFEKIDEINDLPEYSLLVYLYNNYEDINVTINYLKKTASNWYKDMSFGSIRYDYDLSPEEMFKKAQRYYKQIEGALKMDSIDGLFYNDLTKLKNNLEQVLSYSEQAYNEFDGF